MVPYPCTCVHIFFFLFWAMHSCAQGLGDYIWCRGSNLGLLCGGRNLSCCTVSLIPPYFNHSVIFPHVQREPWVFIHTYSASHYYLNKAWWWYFLNPCLLILKSVSLRIVYFGGGGCSLTEEPVSLLDVQFCSSRPSSIMSLDVVSLKKDVLFFFARHMS